jgi:hypothetical protein
VGYAIAVYVMTIEIPVELEPLLKAEAGKAGIDPTTFTQQLLRKSLATRKGAAPCLPEQESALLKAISEGLSAEEMDRYRQLIQKRQQEEIADDELRVLKDLTQRMEALQVRRLEDLVRLAQLRGVALSDLMIQLGIRSPDVL